MQMLKILVRVLGLVLAIPFVTYGFLGLIRFMGLEGTIERYLGVIGSHGNPVTALILVIIGCCLIYGLNGLADRIR
jgi:hypothetical protein